MNSVNTWSASEYLAAKFEIRFTNAHDKIR